MLPVLVVGAGPVGLLQALLLSRHSVPVILLERHTAPLKLPKAHVISSRSLEIFRQCGIPISKIRSFPTKREEAWWVRFVTSMSGTEIGVLPFDKLSVDVLDISPEILHNIPQPDLQGIIAEMLEKEAKVEIRRGWTWRSFTESNTEAVSIVENTYTGETEEIRSSVIIACDGTNSRVRQAAGIELDEQDGPQMMSLHFSADLHPIVKERVGMLYWIMDPAVQGVIIAYDLSGNQVLLHQYDPTVNEASTFTTERCREIIRAALGCDVPFEYLRCAPWRMKSQVARQLQRGRVVLCGDAAHSFPPTGGLGLNSGIADAHNLAWRLSAAYSSSLSLSDALNAYESERRPVAVRNAERAMLYGGKVFGLLKALGLTDSDVETARKKMHDRLQDPAWAGRIADMVEEQREQFSNNNLHMGFVYEPSWHFTSGSELEPAFRHGARLSHAWVKDATDGVLGPDVQPVDLDYVRRELSADKLEKWRYSTLDLVPVGSYVLFCTFVAPWSHLVDDVRTAGFGLRVLRIAQDFGWVDEVAGQAWMSSYGLLDDEGGAAAVLVRPDQYIEAVLRDESEIDGVPAMLGHSLVR